MLERLILTIVQAQPSSRIVQHRQARAIRKKKKMALPSGIRAMTLFSRTTKMFVNGVP
jgi:hypothetical protein